MIKAHFTILVILVVVYIHTESFVNSSPIDPYIQERITTPIKNVKLGISLGLESPASAYFAHLQKETLIGLKVFENWFNNLPITQRTTHYGIPLNMTIEVFENYGRFSFNNPEDYEFLKEQIINMTNDPSLDFVFLPIGSPFGAMLRNASYNAGLKVTVGLAESIESWYNIPGSYGSPTSSKKAMTSILPYLRTNQAKNATVITVDETFQSELCSGFINQAPYNNINISKVITIPFDYNTFGKVTSDEQVRLWNAAVQSVIDTNSDVLVICDYGAASEYTLSKLRTLDYTPKAIMLTYLYGPFEDPSLLEFVTFPSGYDLNANYPAQPYFTNSHGYHDLIKKDFNTDATMTMSYATLAGMVVANAMLKSTNNSTEELLRVMARTSLPTFMGTVSFDIDGRQQLDSLVIQRVKNMNHIIGPALAATHNVIYPMPTWKERITLPTWGHPTEIVAIIFIIVTGIILGGWIIFLVYYRESRNIIAASPLFCALIIVGGFIVIIPLFSWMPSLVSTSICNIRPWFLPIGFMVMFGALIAKTQRIHKLYTLTSVDIVVVTNLEVLLLVLFIVFIQSILSILMVTVGKLESNTIIQDVYRPFLNYKVCTFGLVLKILFGINIGFALLLLAWGTYLAYCVRRIPVSMYDESKSIAFAIYNTALFAGIATTIHLAIGNNNRYLSFMMTVICTCLGVLITTGILFIPKWLSIRHKSSTNSSSHQRNNTTSSSSGSREYNSTPATDISKGKNPMPDSKLKSKNEFLKKRNLSLKNTNTKLLEENAHFKKLLGVENLPSSSLN